jgi:hypothetical protein
MIDYLSESVVVNRAVFGEAGRGCLERSC